MWSASASRGADLPGGQGSAPRKVAVRQEGRMGSSTAISSRRLPAIRWCPPAKRLVSTQRQVVSKLLDDRRLHTARLPDSARLFACVCAPPSGESAPSPPSPARTGLRAHHAPATAVSGLPARVLGSSPAGVGPGWTGMARRPTLSWGMVGSERVRGCLSPARGDAYPIPRPIAGRSETSDPRDHARWPDPSNRSDGRA